MSRTFAIKAQKGAALPSRVLAHRSTRAGQASTNVTIYPDPLEPTFVMRTRDFQEAALLQHVPNQPPQHLRPRMLEPLELSCRIQDLEQPRVTPNLDLDACLTRDSGRWARCQRWSL